MTYKWSSQFSWLLKNALQSSIQWRSLLLSIEAELPEITDLRNVFKMMLVRWRTATVTKFVRANQRLRKITKTILSEVYCRGAPFWPNFIWPILSWISGNKLNLFCGMFLFRPTHEPDIERKFEWWKPKNWVEFKNQGSPNRRFPGDRLPTHVLFCYLVKRTVDLQKHQNRVKLSSHLGL